MIFAFSQLQCNYDWTDKFFETTGKIEKNGPIETRTETKFKEKEFSEWSKRITNGTRLFGKYFQYFSFWRV